MKKTINIKYEKNVKNIERVKNRFSDQIEEISIRAKNGKTNKNLE
ncbi:hypothetical protein GCM10009092_00550 [Bowmanella denitrificans]|uniref:Uncharacterized protein n=1 Tax=Bowmanella denitrificans TaxID=366582 RepID=A0ABN0WJS1_9ALTE